LIYHDALQSYKVIIAQAKTDKKGQLLKDVLRELSRTDLFFLLVYILHRQDANRPWIYDRCREVQRTPDGMLDLWAREHYKSTIITLALTIQNILNDPERTFLILSFKNPIAKAFLIQIRSELENNELLKDLFPDILYQNPRKDSPKWTEEGFLVKRQGNPKELSVECSGLVDGQPTSVHFHTLIYDDPVTQDSVTTPEMIDKVQRSFEASLNLGSEQGTGVKRILGTRWHYNDLFSTIIRRGTATPRIYTATETGKPDGIPVLLSREKLAEKIRDMGSYTASCQLFLDPKADDTNGFKEDWIRSWQPLHFNNMNKYLVCDPAGEKKKGSDYTVFCVIGLGSDRNYYLIDMIRDRLSLTQKGNILFKLHELYNPIMTGYEKYGMQADIQYFYELMSRRNYRFPITELGGSMPKNDRIRRLVPIFEQGRFYIPERIISTQYNHEQVNLINQFLNEEYLLFPFGPHDDILDALARIVDDKLNATFPMIKDSHPNPFDLQNNGAFDEATDYDILRAGL